jgi:hypothetical protein
MSCIAPTTQDGVGNWEIATPSNLCWLMQNINTSGSAPNLTSNYILTTDIDMTTISVPSESIGKQYSFSFTGIFNGNGKTITIGAIDPSYLGLFGFMASGASVINLTVVYPSTITITSTTSGAALALLVGGMPASAISNCSVIVSGNVFMTDLANGPLIGGLIGYSNPSGTITNCTLSISGSVFLVGGDQSYIGMVCGYNECPATSVSVIVQGDISLSGQDGSYIGGISGHCDNSSSLSNITLTVNGQTYMEIPSGPSLNAIGACIGYSTGTQSNVVLNLHRSVFLNKSDTPLIANPIGTQQLTTSPGMSVTFFGIPYIFYNDTATSITDANGNIYPVVSVYTSNGLLISVTDLTVIIDLAADGTITESSPCCLNTIPHVNPQTTDNDYTVLNNKQSGRAIRTNVERFYQSIATNRPTFYSPKPAFGSYRDYMQFLQSQYR